MSPTKRAYLELHFAVLLFGFTAILGNLIQLNALMLVWWRVLLTSISLLFFLQRGKNLKRLSRREITRIMGIGILITLHWLGFYGAIKVSNSSIALVAIATTSFFTALIEPLIMKQKVKWSELSLGILILPGMLLIVESVDWSMMLGIGLGLFSAVMAALFGTLNKVQISNNVDPFTLTFLQLSSSWLFLSTLLVPIQAFGLSEAFHFLPPDKTDWVYLLVLALGCTTLGYILSLRALRHLSAFASSLTINLEPVYGIALAWLILGENKQLTPEFYFGSAVIVLAVLIYPLIRNRKSA